jgi:hypothetical protein
MQDLDPAIFTNEGPAIPVGASIENQPFPDRFRLPLGRPPGASAWRSPYASVAAKHRPLACPQAVRLDWRLVAGLLGPKPRLLDGGFHHGEAYVGQHDTDVLARHRDALGHLSVDQGFEVAAIEHDAQWLGFDDPIVSLANCPAKLLMRLIRGALHRRGFGHRVVDGFVVAHSLLHEMGDQRFGAKRRLVACIINCVKIVKRHPDRGSGEDFDAAACRVLNVDALGIGIIATTFGVRGTDAEQEENYRNRIVNVHGASSFSVIQ